MKLTCTLLVVATLLLAACDRPEDKFVGQYDGEIDMPQDLIEVIKRLALQSGDDPDEVEAGLTGTKIAMELRRDGTCTMSETQDDEAELTDGTWFLNDEGTQITVRIPIGEEEAAARGLPRGAATDRMLDVSEDGKTLTFEETQLGRTVTTTFTRK